MNLGQHLQSALMAHRQGRLDEAEGGYRQLLAARPQAPDVLHLLGVLHYQRGQLVEAEALVRRSIDLQAPSPECANNFGEILRGQGRIAEAAGWYEKALAQQPTYGAAWNNLGLAREAIGDVERARECFEQAIACSPNHPPAWHNLGRIRRDAGLRAEAVECFSRAIQLNPAFAEPRSALGLTLHDLGHHDEALAALDQAVAAHPAFVEAHFNRGVVLQAQRRYAEACAAYARLLQLQPAHADAHNNWGNSLIALEQYPDALAHFEAALRLNPEHVPALSNRGICYRLLGRLPEARASLEEALRRRPDYGEALNNLGLTLQSLGDVPGAIDCFQRAIRLSPRYHGAWNNLALALQEAGRIGDAIKHFERAIELNPESWETRLNLANAWLLAGEHARARASLETCVRQHPEKNAAHDTYLYLLNCIVDLSPADVAERHRAWGRRFASAAPRPAVVPRPPGRIRLGFVSPDFRYHSVSRFLEPLWEKLDRDRCEIFAYSDVMHPDGGTARLQQLADGWRTVAGVPDAAVAEAIAADGVHVLFDLAGHTSGNRLGVFARRAAPTQVSYLGYPNTTGLPVMDFRFTDARADPPGESDALATERLVRLPRTAWCFTPYATHPDVSPLPAATAERFVLGSFNNATKLSAPTVRLWSAAMRAVPAAHLLLKGRVYGDPLVQGRVVRDFAAAGITADRLAFRTWTKDALGHLAVYAEVDLGLDTFPYHGTTTTCEALWMGVPVVSLAGATHASRVGASLLPQVGLDDFVATSNEQFVAIVRHWAEQRAELAALRSELRERMRRSPLMDAAAFARDFEAAVESLFAAPA